MECYFGCRKILDIFSRDFLSFLPVFTQIHIFSNTDEHLQPEWKNVLFPKCNNNSMFFVFDILYIFAFGHIHIHFGVFTIVVIAQISSVQLYATENYTDLFVDLEVKASR